MKDVGDGLLQVEEEFDNGTAPATVETAKARTSTPSGQFGLLVGVIAVTAAVWIPATLLTAPVDGERLRAFSAAIRPGGPGWRRVSGRMRAGPGPALARWLLALAALFGLNFGVGWWLLR